MLNIGWKKKVDKLRVTLLSAGHQPARELPPNLERIIELFREAHRTKDASKLRSTIESLPTPSDPGILWEPLELFGWSIQAAFYRQNGQLWWLLHAQLKTVRSPNEQDVANIFRLVDYLGGDHARDQVFGPLSSPPGHDRIPFGWWTWFNRSPLLEVHVTTPGRTMGMKIVPMGTPPEDGYAVLDLTRNSPKGT